MRARYAYYYERSPYRVQLLTLMRMIWDLNAFGAFSILEEMALGHDSAVFMSPNGLFDSSAENVTQELKSFLSDKLFEMVRNNSL